MTTHDFDGSQAEREGWNIFETTGTLDEGDLRLERVDEAAIFQDDLEAWSFVYARAAEGSEYHRTALSIIAADNPTEAAQIALHLGVDSICA